MSNGERQDKNIENKDLVNFLNLQYERIGGHGNKIWEEMKHFSWALYLLLGAPFILKHYGDINNAWLKIFPILAIFVAIIAILSIRKESRHFLDALGFTEK